MEYSCQNEYNNIIITRILRSDKIYLMLHVNLLSVDSLLLLDLLGFGFATSWLLPI